MMKKRYEIRTGKFGQYFYDTFKNKELSLQDTIDLLNSMADDGYLIEEE